MKEIEKGTGFLVQLIKIGGNRVKVIKLARDFTGLDVTDAKDLVLQAPNAVLRAETAEKAPLKRRIPTETARTTPMP